MPSTNAVPSTPIQATTIESNRESRKGSSDAAHASLGLAQPLFVRPRHPWTALLAIAISTILYASAIATFPIVDASQVMTGDVYNPVNRHEARKIRWDNVMSHILSYTDEQIQRAILVDPEQRKLRHKLLNALEKQAKGILDSAPENAIPSVEVMNAFFHKIEGNRSSRTKETPPRCFPLRDFDMSAKGYVNSMINDTRLLTLARIFVAVFNPNTKTSNLLPFYRMFCFATARGSFLMLWHLRHLDGTSPPDEANTNFITAIHIQNLGKNSIPFNYIGSISPKRLHGVVLHPVSWVFQGVGLETSNPWTLPSISDLNTPNIGFPGRSVPTSTTWSLECQLVNHLCAYTVPGQTPTALLLTPLISLASAADLERLEAAMVELATVFESCVASKPKQALLVTEWLAAERARLARTVHLDNAQIE